LTTETKTPFVVCPLCAKKIGIGESREKLDEYVSKPSNVSEAIAKCFDLNTEGEKGLAILILAQIMDKHPKNEEAAFMYVRLTRYDRIAVKQYLQTFKGDKKIQGFAREFLIMAMTVRNMEYANMFEEYIKNKVSPSGQKKYLGQLREQREVYVGSSHKNHALGFLFTVYVVGAIINLALIPLFILWEAHFLVYAGIAAGALVAEIGFLFFHNKKYGNRLDIGKIERLLMVIFMSSMVVAVGSVFLGAVFRPFAE